MIPAHTLARVRASHARLLTERVEVWRLRDTVSYFGVPNTDEYERVEGLESVACRFSESLQANASEALIEDGTDYDLDTLQVIFAHDTPIEVDDQIRRGALIYYVHGVLDNDSDIVGTIANVKRLRQERVREE